MSLFARFSRSITLLTGGVLTLLMVGTALACKYSVRDVGFVDLDTGRYRLAWCDRQGSSPRILEEIQDAAEAILLNANVSLEFVNVDESPDHLAVEYLREQKQSRFPAAVLIAPDGRFLNVSTGLSGAESGHENWRTLLNEVVSSPLREQILERALSAHSIVLLVEGTNPSHNQRARALAEEAIDAVRSTLDTLPKPVGGPPELVVLPTSNVSHEAVLLWSLGITRDDPAEAHVAVLFGRGRITGSPLVVPGGTATELIARLDYVGRDCECELDRSWMQGVMIPHRWGLSLQEDATRVLGFDPDSPLVKYDMGRILARGTTGTRQNLNIGNAAADDPLLGYTEMALPDLSEPPEEQTVPPEKLSSVESSDKQLVAPPPPEETELPEQIASPSTPLLNNGLTPLQLATILLAVLGGIVLVGGSVLLVRSRRS